MRIGQTSIIVFVSKVIGSAMGFLATLFFARTLGAEVLGIYTLVLTIADWLHYAAGPGVGKAMVKRISEGKEQDQYFTASALMIVCIAVVLSLMVTYTQSTFNNYISGFDEYIALSAVWFIVAFLFVNLFSKSTSSILIAENKVHIQGLLQPVNIGLSSLVQVILVISGFGLLGMLTGWIIGSTVTGLIGTYWVCVRPAWPEKRHFRSLFDYAKFSWLSGLKSRAFNQVDILLLGIFVPTSLVGIYSVSWSIAKFLELFGQAISGTVFPESCSRKFSGDLWIGRRRTDLHRSDSNTGSDWWRLPL
jgi:O-antigen/teichoic acid export membrane protein